MQKRLIQTRFLLWKNRGWTAAFRTSIAFLLPSDFHQTSIYFPFWPLKEDVEPWPQAMARPSAAEWQTPASVRVSIRFIQSQQKVYAAFMLLMWCAMSNPVCLSVCWSCVCTKSIKILGSFAFWERDALHHAPPSLYWRAPVACWPWRSQEDIHRSLQ